MGHCSGGEVSKILGVRKHELGWVRVQKRVARPAVGVRGSIPGKCLVKILHFGSF